MGLKRPLALTLVALLNAFGALVCLGYALLMVLASRSGSVDNAPRGLLYVLAVIMSGLGVFYAITAIGLWGLKAYGRICQIVISVLGLLAIPFGTIAYGVLLYYLTRPGVKLLFSDASVLSMRTDERELVNRDAYGGAATAIAIMFALFGAVVAIGVVAAVMVPSLLRSRGAANEASIVRALQSFNSAQAEWLAANTGQYTEPACLGAPENCGDTRGAGPYLSLPELAAMSPYRGYTFGFALRRAFTPARTLEEESLSPTSIPNFENMSQADIAAEIGRRRATAAARQATAAAVAKGGYTYWAVPEDPGKTGRKRFCTDETGVVLAYPLDIEWTEPTEVRPNCPEGGDAVR